MWSKNEENWRRPLCNYTQVNGKKKKKSQRRREEDSPVLDDGLSTKSGDYFLRASSSRTRTIQLFFDRMGSNHVSGALILYNLPNFGLQIFIEVCRGWHS